MIEIEVTKHHMHRVLRESGIPQAAVVLVGIDMNVSPHWMRHAYASHALQRGCKVAVVQATLVHNSLAVTSVYVHVKPSDSAGLYQSVG